MATDMNSGIVWSGRTITREEAVARIMAIIEDNPGITIYSLDRLANVAEFPDGIRLPDLLEPLVEGGVLQEGRSPKGAPIYFLAE